MIGTTDLYQIERYPEASLRADVGLAEKPTYGTEPTPPPVDEVLVHERNIRSVKIDFWSVHKFCISPLDT